MLNRMLSTRSGRMTHGIGAGVGGVSGAAWGGCVGCGVGLAAGQVCEGVLELARPDNLDVGVEPADGGGQADP